ncbi:hypothetical protein ACLOJK_010779 [Asimina triloba]
MRNDLNPKAVIKRLMTDVPFRVLLSGSAAVFGWGAGRCWPESNAARSDCWIVTAGPTICRFLLSIFIPHSSDVAADFFSAVDRCRNQRRKLAGSGTAATAGFSGKGTANLGHRTWIFLAAVTGFDRTLLLEKRDCRFLLSVRRKKTPLMVLPVMVFLLLGKMRMMEPAAQ